MAMWRGSVLKAQRVSGLMPDLRRVGPSKSKIHHDIKTKSDKCSFVFTMARGTPVKSPSGTEVHQMLLKLYRQTSPYSALPV